jgi:hypothetical protein
MQHAGIETADALRIAAISHHAYRVAIDKGSYKCAPPAVRGRRVWDIDELVVLAWFSALVKGGMKRNMAGGMAGELSKAIARDPAANEFNVFMWEDQGAQQGKLAIGREPPDEAPDAQIVLAIPLAELRLKVRAAAENFQRRATRRGK